ncbi:MAG: N-acetylmuramoyl-L-alanine amidase [Flavobacteriaceae bacterium]|nr:N-acetylmuramoyl-L-alanine amidase [Flavobacteriaceae bacterium]
MQTFIKYSLLLFIVILTCFESSYAQSSKFVIVLDAGHGGKDPGKHSKYGLNEKDIALDIVLKVGKELEKHQDIKVIYTRKNDVFVTLRGRASIANKADADLFVSIHCNAHNTSAYGAETYVLGLHANEANFNVAKKENEVIFLEEDYEIHYEGFDPNSPESLIGLTLLQEDYLDQSTQLARYIQDNFIYNLKRKDRGLKQAGFWVLHNTYMPSVLIETGFITNKNEGKYLNSKKGKSEMSDAIYKAIVKYKSGLNGVSESVKNADKNVYPEINFKVQIAASKRRLETKSFNFKGLKDISREHVNGLYKYYYGNTSDFNKIKTLKQEAKFKGYHTCFIVALKNGERISVDEALKTTSN